MSSSSEHSSARPQELAAAIALSLLIVTQPTTSRAERNGQLWKLQGRWDQFQARAVELERWR